MRTWPKFSNRKIAEICGVDEKTVRNLKSTADSPQLESDQKTIGLDGKLRKAPKSKTGPKQGKDNSPRMIPLGPEEAPPPVPVGPQSSVAATVPYEVRVADFARDVLLANPEVPGAPPMTWDSRWDRAQVVHLALYQEWPAEKRAIYVQNCLDLYQELGDGGTARRCWKEAGPTT